MLRRGWKILVWLLVPLIGLGAGYAVAAFVDQRGRPVPTDVIVYEPARFPGLDPFVPAAIDESGESAPGLISGDKPCDAEGLLGALDARPELLRAWATVLSLDPNAVGDYVRSLRSDFVMADTPVTDHGFRNGETYPFHAVLGEGTAVLREEDATPVVRCRSGSPLVKQSCPPNCKTPPSPTPEPTPIPTIEPDFGDDNEGPRPTRRTRTPAPTARPSPTLQATAAPTAPPFRTPDENGDLFP
jgi:hypothetical protein